MTLHAIVGDGEMPPEEVISTLDAIWDADENSDQNFWFVLIGKSGPTDTDKAIAKWLTENEIFYSVITDDASSLDPVYAPAQTFTAKALNKKLLAVLAAEPDDGEPTDVLALFTSDDPEAESDRWLNETMVEVQKAGHSIRALNDGLTELDFTVEDEPEPEEEVVVDEQPDPKKPKKKASKKTASEDPPAEVADVTEEKSLDREYTREELEEMQLPDLKAILAAKGMSLPPRTRVPTYINTILGEDEVATAEPSDDVADLARRVEALEEKMNRLVSILSE